jgi:hypothetical protein
LYQFKDRIMNHHRHDSKLTITHFWATILAVIFTCIFLFSCMTPNKATNYLKKKDLLDDTCAANFPVKDSIMVVTVDSVHFETLYLDGQVVVDSIYLERGEDKQYEITKVITKTITKTVEVKTRDRAFENVLLDANVVIEKKLGQTETKAAALEEEKTILQGKIKAKNKKIFWLYIIIALLTAWNFRKPIARLINPIKTIIPI